MKTQSGRSMIEMLGVLAIIGVLSVGGLAGYTKAMRAHRANEILDYEGRCYVEARSKGDGISEDTTGVTYATNVPTGLTSAGVTCTRAAGGVTTCVFTAANSDIAETIGNKVGISCSSKPKFTHVPGATTPWACATASS